MPTINRIIYYLSLDDYLIFYIKFLVDHIVAYGNVLFFGKGKVIFNFIGSILSLFIHSYMRKCFSYIMGVRNHINMRTQ